MDENPTVYNDGAQQIRDIVKRTFGDTFKSYFIGAPDALPEAALPCVVIQKVSGTFKSGATMTDDRTENILVQVFANSKDGLGAPDTDDTVMRMLFNRVEAIDPTTGRFKPDTLMSALRTNLTLDQTVINNDIEIQYDVTPRADQPTIYEVVIVVSILRRVYIPDRM